MNCGAPDLPLLETFMWYGKQLFVSFSILGIGFGILYGIITWSERKNR